MILPQIHTCIFKKKCLRFIHNEKDKPRSQSNEKHISYFYLKCLDLKTTSFAILCVAGKKNIKFVMQYRVLFHPLVYDWSVWDFFQSFQRPLLKGVL